MAPKKLRNGKLSKEAVLSQQRLQVVCANALTGETVATAELSHGTSEVTLQSLFQCNAAADHPQMHTTFLREGREVDANWKPWTVAEEEAEGNVITKIVRVLVVQWLPQIRLVPFVSIANQQRSIELREFAFDLDAQPNSNKVLLRDVLPDWIRQVRRGNSEMHRLVGALLADLLSNPVARKRNLVYGLGDFRRDPTEQHITIVFDREPCRCKFQDQQRVYDPSPQDIDDVLVDLRRFF